ncbi:hypothetical protein [uncultured Hymenobacter sp.]|uniref:hypothetical protein n=1 Tax=uncultured Hymenobacter sp. TaxID=170016 RepID=UPI0035CC6687
MSLEINQTQPEPTYDDANTVISSEAVGSVELNVVATSSKRHKLSGAVVSTATKLLPLVQLLETIQPLVTNESVFHTRRLKINAQIALVYEQLKDERPKRKALLVAFKTMGDLVLEETRDISKDELKQAAKEVVLATLKNAPAIISAAHQAKLLS